MRLLAPILAAALAGCLDLKPAPAPPVRWLSLVGATTTRPGDMPPPVEPGLDLGVVRAAGGVGDVHLRRVSEVEVEQVELVRWVERPEITVERTLEDELYRRRGFRRGGTRRLDVEVLAFEESLAPRHRAVVVLEVLLTDGDEVLLDRRIEGSQPISGADPALVARALGQALEGAVTELSDLLALR